MVAPLLLVRVTRSLELVPLVAARTPTPPVPPFASVSPELLPPVISLELVTVALPLSIWMPSPPV